MNPTTTTPMQLHPYLTPDLLELIRSGSPETIARRLALRYSDMPDEEMVRLGFRVEAQISGGRRFGVNRPITYEGFNFSGGYRGLKRRVCLKTKGDWREHFIIRFNEVLHDCESRLAATKAQQESNEERHRLVKARKSAVLPLVEPLSSACSWKCENRYSHGIAENLLIETASFTPEQIAQITNLVRSFAP